MAGGLWVVVPDINVWLTVARNLGPFTLEQVRDRLKRGRWSNYPNDVFDFLSTLLRGHPDGAPIQIWSGEHIEDGAFLKATQPDDTDLRIEDRGLGWTRDEAECIPELIDAMVNFTGGGYCDRTGTYGHPPLDYEDGTVLQIARMAAHDVAVCNRVCVTYDLDFIRKRKHDPLVSVMSPREWCTRYASRKRMADMSMMLQAPKIDRNAEAPEPIGDSGASA